MTTLIGQEAEHLCHWCACVFLAPLSQQWNANFYCSMECRLSKRREAQRIARPKREGTPARIAYNRARNRLWRMRNQKAVGTSPWLLGAPPCGPKLPCLELDVAFAPMPKWPITIRNMRGVHGAVSALLGDLAGLRHRKHSSTFAVRIHEANALRVVVWDERARDLLEARHVGRLWDRPTEFYVRDLVEIDAPKVSLRRGRIPVRVTAITPVTMNKDNHSKPEVRPTKDSFVRALTGTFQERVGMSVPGVMAEVIDVRTEPVHVNLGGKYGPVPGWVGEVDLHVNAPALWLLRCAESVGLGARVGFGFGRISVEEIDE